MENRSESVLHRCEATKAVAKKAQKKNPEASTGLKPTTSTILMQCSTNRAMKLARWKQVKSEFNLHPLYEESEITPNFTGFKFQTTFCGREIKSLGHII